MNNGFEKKLDTVLAAIIAGISFLIGIALYAGGCHGRELDCNPLDKAFAPFFVSFIIISYLSIKLTRSKLGKKQ